MKTISVLLILTAIILAASAASAEVLCCDWYSWAEGGSGGCIGACFDESGSPDTSKACQPVVGAYQTCACQETVVDDGCGWIDYAATEGGYCGGECPDGEECVGESNECWCEETVDEGCGLKSFPIDSLGLQGAEGQCGGACDNGGDCVPNIPTDVIGTAAPCYCRPPVNVPEFATGLVALAVMLMSPAFAYLAVRKRH